MDRESFLSRAQQRPTMDITLPGGETVRARKLTQAEVERIRKNYATDDKALEGFRFVVAQCLVDEEGKRLLKDEDLKALAEMDFETIQSIATEVMKFSGIKIDPKND